MKVGEWTEVRSLNRGKTMETYPIRDPWGFVHEVGVLLSKKKPNKMLLILQLFLTWKVKQEAQIIIIKRKDSRITNNHTQSLQTYSETPEYTLKSSKNNKNPVIVKKESLSCNKQSIKKLSHLNIKCTLFCNTCYSAIIAFLTCQSV